MFPTNNYRTDSDLIILSASVRELHIISSKDGLFDSARIHCTLDSDFIVIRRNLIILSLHSRLM